MSIVDLIYGKLIAESASRKFEVKKADRQIDVLFAGYCIMRITERNKWCVDVSIEDDRCISCESFDAEKMFEAIRAHYPWLYSTEQYHNQCVTNVLCEYERIVKSYSQNAPCAFLMIPPKIDISRWPRIYIGSDGQLNARNAYAQYETAALKQQAINEGDTAVQNANNHFDKTMINRCAWNDLPTRLTGDQFVARIDAFRAEIKARFPDVPFEPYWSDKGAVVDGWCGHITFEAVDAYLKSR